MKKRLFAMLMVVVLIASVFVGCGGTNEAAETKAPSEGSGTESAGEVSEKEWSGTLKVQLIGGWELEDKTDPMSGKKTKGLQAVKEEFERLYPGATLEFYVMGWDSYQQKTQAMLNANEVDVYQVPGIASLADQGLLEPLAPYIEKDNFDLNVYVDGQIDGWRAMGPEDDSLEIYGLPFLGDTRVICYDKVLFDQWGVEYLSLNPTVEEIKEKAEKMTGTNPVTGEMNYGIMFRGKDAADTLVNIAEGFGGTWGEGFRFNELKFNFNSKEFVDAANWFLDIKELAPKGILTDQGVEAWWTPENNIAINMRVIPSQMLGSFALEGMQERIGVSMLYTNPELGMGGMFAGSPIAIGKSSEQKDLAWEYLKFVSSDFFQKHIHENNNEFPVIKGAAEWESFKSIPQKQVLLDSMAKLWTPRYPYRAGQPRYILSENVDLMMLGDLSVEEALNKAQTEAEAWVQEQ
ncbi:extracellular solute-binding protein [Acidaminobacter sp. JC074]|uniref:extracellular solute-binding protein n=1 Tax=Acidaminobacter sp. JC074 TaxID=2530199 RepID=UPI001F0DE98D|nr:extracellular solute-binding protein [Acidaminobacter sp. JC074]MCH4889649.1 extracellular solute-binding protein [Acidaminobacter sp. JC074]